MMRDLLAGDVPTVLRADLYALAALAAAGIVSLGRHRELGRSPDAARCRGLCVPTLYGHLSRMAGSQRPLAWHGREHMISLTY